MSVTQIHCIAASSAQWQECGASCISAGHCGEGARSCDVGVYLTAHRLAPRGHVLCAAVEYCAGQVATHLQPRSDMGCRASDHDRLCTSRMHIQMMLQSSGISVRQAAHRPGAAHQLSMSCQCRLQFCAQAADLVLVPLQQECGCASGQAAAGGAGAAAGPWLPCGGPARGCFWL